MPELQAGEGCRRSPSRLALLWIFPGICSQPPLELSTGGALETACDSWHPTGASSTGAHSRAGSPCSTLATTPALRPGSCPAPALACLKAPSTRRACAAAQPHSQQASVSHWTRAAQAPRAGPCLPLVLQLPPCPGAAAGAGRTAGGTGRAEVADRRGQSCSPRAAAPGRDSSRGVLLAPNLILSSSRRVPLSTWNPGSCRQGAEAQGSSAFPCSNPVPGQEQQLGPRFPRLQAGAAAGILLPKAPPAPQC